MSRVFASPQNSVLFASCPRRALPLRTAGHFFPTPPARAEFALVFSEWVPGPPRFLPYLLRMFTASYKYLWSMERLNQKSRWYTDHKWLISDKFMFCVFAFMTLLHFWVTFGIMLGVGLDYYRQPILNCDTKTNTRPQTYLGFVYLVSVLAFVFVLRRLKIDDAFYIKREMTWVAGFVFPLFIAFIISVNVKIPGYDTFILQIPIYWLAFIFTIYYPIILSYISAVRLKRTDSFFNLVNDADSTKTNLMMVDLASPSSDAAAKASIASNVSETQDRATESDVLPESSTPSTPTEKVAVQVDPARPMTPMEAARQAALAKTSMTALQSSTSQLGEPGQEVEPLAIIIEHPIFLEAFKKFSAQCWCSENILFYLDAMNFKHRPFNQAELDRIRREYLQRNASFELNIPESLLKTVTRRLDAGDCDCNSLDPVIAQIHKHLKFDIYPRFRLSNLFRDARRRANTPAHV
ncbi:hypothetical protein, variant [Capsaspora owczarzaki ATCC 30864]|uniref:RGS domain-containing protein n=1 Tax=Capsaspora owczarzaki (strain ATCC 30864) TaxID=595528 RepID=A0A0D2U8N7_CAPO3|nr:hypothetical protein, variant [Capsaspora owczarzaki ATCC 30864]